METERAIANDMKHELEQIDTDNLKFDAIIQLKTWQRKMQDLIDQTYQTRLKQINSLTSERNEQIDEIHHQLRNLNPNDKKAIRSTKESIDMLKSPISVVDSIPDNFNKKLERTIRIRTIAFENIEELDDEEETDDDDQEDDDDEPVIVDFENEKHSNGHDVTIVQVRPPEEGRMSKVFYSQPVQHALGVTLARGLTHVGTIAAVSTTTAAATTMAKTAVITTACGIGTIAYGVGKLAIGATQKVWSMVVSSDDY